MEPELGDLGNELIQPSVVFGDGMVSQPLATGTSQENKAFVLSGLTTTVSKTKELKPLSRFPSFAVSAIGRLASELHELRFLRVQFESELLQPFLEGFEARSRFGFVFKTDHEVIRITHHDTLPSAVTIPPLIDPRRRLRSS